MPLRLREFKEPSEIVRASLARFRMACWQRQQKQICDVAVQKNACQALGFTRFSIAADISVECYKSIITSCLELDLHNDKKTLALKALKKFEVVFLEACAHKILRSKTLRFHFKRFVFSLFAAMCTILDVANFSSDTQVHAWNLKKHEALLLLNLQTRNWSEVISESFVVGSLDPFSIHDMALLRITALIEDRQFEKALAEITNNRHEAALDSEMLSDQVYALIALNRDEDAMLVLRKALNRNENDKTALSQRAGLELRHKDYLGALKDFNKLSNLPSCDSDQIEFLRLQILRGMGRNREARTYLKNFMSQHLNSSKSFTLSGDQNMFDNKLDKAILDYNRALRLAPSDLETRNRRGWTAAQRGDFKTVVEDYAVVAAAAKVNGLFDDAQKNLALVNVMSGDFITASKQLDTLIRRDDTRSGWPLVIRSCLSGKLNNVSAVYADATRAINLFPFAKCESVAFSNRAWAYNKFGLFPAAIDDARQSIKLDKSSFIGYVHLGNALLSLNKPTLAFTAFSNAIKKDSNCKPAYLGRAKCFEFLGNIASKNKELLSARNSKWVDHAPCLLD